MTDTENSKIILKEVDNAVSGESKLEQVCSQCNNIFSSKGNRNPYIKYVNLKMKHDFSCSVCQTTFNRKGDLRNHNLTAHHNHTTTANNLSQASFQHDVFKNFICDICLKEFKLRDSLLQHRKYHFTDLESKEENKYYDKTNISSDDCQVKDTATGEVDNSNIFTHDNKSKDEIENDDASKSFDYIQAEGIQGDTSTRNFYDESTNKDDMITNNVSNSCNNEDEIVNERSAT